jgi:hypothetical protein
MDRKKMMLAAVIGTVLVFCAIAAVTANSLAMNTPLYTYRMEQVSSEMNFLPTEMNGFSYIADKGYTLDYKVTGYCGGVEPLSGVFTCALTCQSTCPYTCPWTCLGNTCGTCLNTCPYTCKSTCGQYTCDDTCNDFTCPTTHLTCFGC